MRNLIFSDLTPPKTRVGLVRGYFRGLWRFKVFAFCARLFPENSAFLVSEDQNGNGRFAHHI